MKELATVQSQDGMMAYLKDTWVYQVKNGLKKGSFPRSKPSQIYVELFGSMPFSYKLKGYLKELDAEYQGARNEDYQFIFRYRGGTLPVIITRVAGYQEAMRKALGKVVKETSFGIPSVPLAKQCLNLGTLTVDYTKLN